MTPSDATKQAFDNLWKVQTQAGGDKGAWDWLDFGLEPWESKGARYYGAALAAIAVGSAPGYYKATADTVLDGKVEMLRVYLKGKFADQNLHNRAGPSGRRASSMECLRRKSGNKSSASCWRSSGTMAAGVYLPSALRPRRWDAARYVFRCLRHRVHSSYPADGWGGKGRREGGKRPVLAAGPPSGHRRVAGRFGQ